MYDCHYYWLFAPHRGGIVDNSERKPAFDIAVVLPDQTSHSLSLFCDQEGLPHFARLTVNYLPTEEIPTALLPTLQAIKEHLLVVLRFTYRTDLVLAEPGIIWSFTATGEPARVSISIEDRGQDSFVPENARNLFLHSFPLREILRLYADGEDKRIPLQYRFLSFYKFLELRYKEQGHWKHQEVDALLRPYAADFSALGYTKKPFVVIHEMRDRCAHIKTGRGSGRELLGVTHLNHAAAVKVSELLPIMRAICANVVNERAKGTFALHTEVIKDDHYAAPDPESISQIHQ